MKFYIILGDPAIKKKGWLIFMKNQKNTTLAMDILRAEVRRTRTWKTAFVVAFAVVVIDRIIEKGGTDND